MAPGLTRFKPDRIRLEPGFTRSKDLKPGVKTLLQTHGFNTPRGSKPTASDMVKPRLVSGWLKAIAAGWQS